MKESFHFTFNLKKQFYIKSQTLQSSERFNEFFLDYFVYISCEIGIRHLISHQIMKYCKINTPFILIIPHQEWRESRKRNLNVKEAEKKNAVKKAFKEIEQCFSVFLSKGTPRSR